MPQIQGPEKWLRQLKQRWREGEEQYDIKEGEVDHVNHLKELQISFWTIWKIIGSFKQRSDIIWLT